MYVCDCLEPCCRRDTGSMGRRMTKGTWGVLVSADVLGADQHPAPEGVLTSADLFALVSSGAHALCWRSSSTKCARKARHSCTGKGDTVKVRTGPSTLCKTRGDAAVPSPTCKRRALVVFCHSLWCCAAATCRVRLDRCHNLVGPRKRL